MLMPSPESPESRQSVETLLVLDGTWHETKELLRRIPQLSNLPKAALPINLAAKADGRLMIRRCKRNANVGSFVCTLGATIAALEVLEPELASRHRREWLGPLHKLVEIQIRMLPHRLQAQKGTQVVAEYIAAGVPIVGPLSEIPTLEKLQLSEQRD
eukprot:jgi/Bigna1/61159/fgenesh1_kg.18_\